jgi:hypothetical protein
MSRRKTWPFPANLEPYKVSLPARRRGRASVSRYTVTHKRADEINWRIVLHDEDRAWAYPGRYTGLTVDGIMVMSDEAKEITDHIPFIEKATGRILVTGLGIGMVLQALLCKPEVEHVTVVELSADVLALVSPHYLTMFGGERMSLVNDSAFDWRPPTGSRFDYAWHDIWPIAFGAYWPEHERLFDRYSAFATEQDSWRGEWMRRRYENGVKP